MSIYECAKCGCAENTALGHFWSRMQDHLFTWDKSNEKYKGERLCSECGPKFYNDGKPTSHGKWHGKFPKEPFVKSDTTL